MSDCNYRIYPSLLDKFIDMLNYGEQAEEPWNKVSETDHKRGEYLDKEVGDYILQPDELATKIEIEMINSINRCPKEVSQAADRGTCFNEIVDCFIKHKPCGYKGMTLRTINDKDGNQLCIEATLNGNAYYYDVQMCRDAAAMLSGALCQQYVEAPISTSYGKAMLYGYIDEWVRDIIVDIKTTSTYDFGKFQHKTQRLLYPYCALTSGQAERVESFVYLVYKWDKKRKLTIGEEQPVEVEVWGATYYPEAYTYNYQRDTAELTKIVEQFLDWLEYRRAYITDRRIFGGENPKGYVGKKLTSLSL